MQTKEYFKEGKNDIKWVGNNFTNWFYGTSFTPIKNPKLVFKKLETSMNDAQIIEKWSPEPVTLDVLAYALKNPAKTNLLKNGYANIFYIKDKDSVLRAVLVGWRAVGGGWDVAAGEVSDPGAWDGGGQVFSRKFLESSETSPDTQSLKPSDPSDLESRLKKLEAWAKNLGMK